ncbi:MAG: hypothetical protein ACOVQR_07140 [Flavobacterium sp.]|jgi:hypothetical protein|uniref:hypothetical protein n=1 Tax=Flavobacterium sp. TaxID=239 RepID=UPI003BA6710B
MNVKKLFSLETSKINSLIQASQEINSLNNIIVSDDKVIWVDLFKLKTSPDDMVTFSLLFYNMGVITTTNVYLEKETLGNLKKIKGSIIDFQIDTNSNLTNKTLDIYSAVTSSNLTSPLPLDFKVSLIIKGGKGTITYPIVDMLKFNEVGQTFEVNFSIFMY